MPIYLAIISFAAGIILVIKGGDWFVDAAVNIAEMAGVPHFIIGATIVSIATTLPEMIVSAIAAHDGLVEMAIGNAVGSVTANTGLIMGIAMLFLTVAVQRRQYIGQCALLIVSAAVLFVGSQGGVLSLWAEIVLAVIFVVFMCMNLKAAKGEMNAASDTRTTPGKGEVLKNAGFFVLGAGCIVLGSDLLVDGGSAIASALGVPERVVAVTLVAIGTSLPELVTTLTAIKKKQASLSVGNIIGANIIDLTVILPVCSLVSGQLLPVSAQSAGIDMGACLLIIVAALVPMLVYQKTGKWQGAVCLAMYGAYLVVTI
jgi:cation:H+ antiporter